MTETARLGWVIAYVPDVEAAVAFYEKAFGLARRFVVDDYGELDTGATTLAFAAEDLGRANFEGGVQRLRAGAGGLHLHEGADLARLQDRGHHLDAVQRTLERAARLAALDDGHRHVSEAGSAVIGV
jgi:catechol 2,3-dioxygenase-like lactoylglutathione lyase family enzyme